MTPTVTVAIAFHDERPVLAAAIASILRQSHAHLELLLLDDGSADGSRAIAEGFQGDPRVRLLPGDGRRRHLAARLNQALREARGRYFARMDADDVSHPARLAQQLAAIEGRDAVGTWAGLVDEREHPFGVIEANVPPDRTSLVARGLIAHATMLADTAWLREHPYDEGLTRAEDRDLWCRVGLQANVSVVEDVLYVVRVRPSEPGFFGDYLRGQSDLRRVIRRHGPALAGLPRTGELLARSMLKTAAMSAAWAAGHGRAIVLRRGRRPTDAERTRIAEALQAP